ncbi:hypothetical protein [Pinibacter aurantiacus]|uniref:Uncharacterized protein n=1 Tax=Pinibacter aurantiacus TaxID=2851599 RepID=A0A9E2S7Q2_9BACT|nr:hypothetical protein [Pinibacter aurantiacus]MBV4357147.1 hypothetical protein [Pinibacter aurantiacus]
MDYIKEIINKPDYSLEEIIGCFEKVKENGDVAVIKFDGERGENSYTVFVSFPTKKRDMLRADENDLKTALLKVLSKYIE